MNLIEYTRMYEVEDHHWWYVGLHELVLAAVRRESQRLGRPLDIFDAGCGTGRLCQLLHQQGHKVTGCDASEEAMRLCRRRGISGVYQADLNALDLEPESFDVITSLDVLYHTGITDDVAVMRRLRKGIRPGGSLIMNLVAHEFLRSTHDIAVHTRERYTKDSLCLRLQDAGFSSEFATYRVSILFPFIALYRRLSRRAARKKTNHEEVDSDVSLPYWPVNSTLLKIVEMENMFLRVATLPFGSSVFVVARNV